MLVVLPVFPVPSPFEAMFGKQFEAQIVMICSVLLRENGVNRLLGMMFSTI